MKTIHSFFSFVALRYNTCLLFQSGIAVGTFVKTFVVVVIVVVVVVVVVVAYPIFLCVLLPWKNKNKK